MVNDKPTEHNKSKFFNVRGRTRIAIGGFALVISFLLFFEHRAHISSDLVFVIVILGACLGMHFFMHGSHGSHSSHAPHDNGNSPSNDDDMRGKK